MGHLLYVSLKELIERIWQQIKGESHQESQLQARQDELARRYEILTERLNVLKTRTLEKDDNISDNREWQDENIRLAISILGWLARVIEYYDILQSLRLINIREERHQLCDDLTTLFQRIDDLLPRHNLK